MEENFSEVKKQTTLTDKDIFIKIWTSPREVLKFINDKKYDKYVAVLLILSGISRSFDRASIKNMGDDMSLWTIIGLSIFLGGIFGWITYYIYAALLSWTGKWLNGKGNTDSILRILSYGMFPSVVALIFLIPQISIYGIEIFKAEGNLISQGIISNIFFYTSFLLESILGIWTIVLCVIGISEVQKISIGKSILNLLLPAMIIVIPLFLILWIFLS